MGESFFQSVVSLTTFLYSDDFLNSNQEPEKISDSIENH